MKGIPSHNINEQIHCKQMGGTAIAALGCLCDIIAEVGNDSSSLAHWSWIKLGLGAHVTWVVLGYLPCKPGKNSQGCTAWDQQSRFFQSHSDFHYPSTIFIEQIISQITLWCNLGEQVIFAIDSYQNVYTGNLAAQLHADHINMDCLFESALGTRVPISHFWGSSLITTIFGSPGLGPGHAMC
jgi:hypothetical protein